MAKKKGGKRRQGADRIQLRSALGSDDDEGGVVDNIELEDPVDRHDAEERRDLARKVAKNRRGDRYGEDRSVFQVSDGSDDSDEDVEKIVRKKLKAEKKAAKKKGKKKAEEVAESSDDEFASDLDDGGADGGKYEDELVGGEGWGQRKKYFYGGNSNERGRPAKGDTGDPEEEDEADIEARESKKLQANQLEDMDEEDFLDTFGDSSENLKSSKSKTKSSTTSESIKADLSQLSKKERARLFAKEAPEFAGVVAEFGERAEEVRDRLAPVVRLMDEGKIPSDGVAAEFVRAKYQLTLNYCANLSCYLMFKAKRAPLKLHPLTGRLVQYKQLLEEVEPLDSAMSGQVDQLLALAEEEGGVESAVRKAKKRAVREALRQKNANKKLKILGGAEEPAAKKAKVATPRKEEDLTLDEMRALEMYRATRKGAMEPETDDDDSEEEGARVETAEENGREKQQGEDDEEEEGEDRRLITRQIEKNKGLTPKRSKLQRNPRVKHRVKFQKAKVRRKGQVREVRTEVKKYAGEVSGINARVKKGIKLA